MYDSTSAVSHTFSRAPGAPRAGEEPVSPASQSILYERSDTSATLFRQLSHALAILSSASELTLNQNREGAHNLRIWLQPSARQAEEALHRLREINMAQSPALMDLVQSLTVLVLAADMIAHGQLVGDMATDAYNLMRRNAERAMACMLDLHVLSEG